MASSAEDQLFACLCPGQGRYSPDKAGLLAARLREVADSLTPQNAREAEPDAPDTKRRRKEQRGRGAGRRRQRGGSGGPAPASLCVCCQCTSAAA